MYKQVLSLAEHFKPQEIMRPKMINLNIYMLANIQGARGGRSYILVLARASQQLAIYTFLFPRSPLSPQSDCFWYKGEQLGPA